MDNFDDIFERRLVFPNGEAGRRFCELVGIDEVKSVLVKSIGIALHPDRLRQWGHLHGLPSGLLEIVLRRPPLFMLCGDVGTGKTQLAESIGDPVARELDMSITLFPVSLSARGTGRVGEMTKLVSSAFEYAIQEADKFHARKGGAPSGGILLLVDEADALAQSRETEQMHHEDRAGVNAFIRGVDRIANAQTPVVVIMCTNRLSAIDPAVRRRAATMHEFSRPNAEQAKAVLGVLAEAGFSGEQMARLAEVVTNRTNQIGFTYSDLTQRLLPAIVLDAYPDNAIGFQRAMDIVSDMTPTPSFRD